MQRPDWFDKLQPYADSDKFNSTVLIATSIVPYAALMAVMFLLMVRGYPFWTIVPVAFVAAAFQVRTFMILHDCAHTSFYKSKRICSIMGHACGIFTFTPFFDWQRNHGIHHATVSNLDKRGTGDVWTMTLGEYRSSNLRTRLKYRFFRNPFFLFLTAPMLLFVLAYRFPQKSTRRKDYFSIIFTDVMLALIIVGAYYTVGLKTYFTVQMSVFYIASCSGVWIFYIQHQFGDVYWAHAGEWDLISAATKGSSFYKLPGVLRWFTANIGYHNLHHLKPRIPCYNLKKCYDNVPELHYTVPITFLSGFKSLRLHLWDEETGTLISFREANRRIRQAG